jgi:hypothetical protein
MTFRILRLLRSETVRSPLTTPTRSHQWHAHESFTREPSQYQQCHLTRISVDLNLRMFIIWQC